MKRFIKTLTISRIGMIIVKHDADAHTFRVLQWMAEDDRPRELEQFRYTPNEFAKSDSVRLHAAQGRAITFATGVFEHERKTRRSQIQAAS